MRDVLLYDGSEDSELHALYSWARHCKDLHAIPGPDPHRLQLERWLYDTLHGTDQRVLDIGQHDTPRRWIGEGYKTYGFDKSNDYVGDMCAMPFSEEWDFILCTEVLEHCEDPFTACRSMWGALKPGGILMASAPFCWPDHHTPDYPDYWRFTEQAWRLLLKDYSKVTVTPMEWSPEGESLYNLMRRFEGFGYRDTIQFSTGFMVEAVR